jgi:hypothetical protein
MKTIKTLVPIIVIAFFCNLSLKSEVPTNVVPFDKTVHKIFPEKESISFKGFPNDLIISTEGKSKYDNLQSQIDTLDKFRERGTSFGVYPISINGNDYPLTGWNPIYHLVGARIDYLTPGVKLKGILVSYLLKTFRGTNYDDLYSCIYKTENGIPTGDVLGMKRFTINNIDTSRTELLFTPIMFDNPLSINSSFACMLTTSNGTNEFDATAIYSNVVGNGNHEQTVVVIIVTSQGAVSMTLGDMLAQLGVGDPDIDIIMIPIVEGNSAGTDDELKIDGFTLHNIFPNPSDGRSVISFTGDKPVNVDINLISTNGLRVKNLVNRLFDEGLHSVELDFTDVAAGAYFYTINAGGKYFGGKINIVK